MALPLPYPIHTIVEIARAITQGEDPWFALGSFLHDWWCDAVEYRHELIDEAPLPVLHNDLSLKRWLAFYAAMVEELCVRTSFPCPDWVYASEYVLDQPWFYYPQASQREWLLEVTPEPFKQRNIFVGESVLDNKYELQQQFDAKPRWAMWSEQELARLQNMDAMPQ